MTPNQIKAIVKELRQDGELPVCAFQLRSGPIHTGTWQVMSMGLIMLTLSDRDAPPIYIDCIAVDAIAVSNANGPRAANTEAVPVPLPRAARSRSMKPTSSHGGSTTSSTR